MTDSPSSKKRYVTLTWEHVGTMVVPPEGEADCRRDEDEPPHKVGEVWLTDAEFEALPEFESV